MTLFFLHFLLMWYFCLKYVKLRHFLSLYGSFRHKNLGIRVKSKSFWDCCARNRNQIFQLHDQVDKHWELELSQTISEVECKLEMSSLGDIFDPNISCVIAVLLDFLFVCWLVFNSFNILYHQVGYVARRMEGTQAEPLARFLRSMFDESSLEFYTCRFLDNMIIFNFKVLYNMLI